MKVFRRAIASSLCFVLLHLSSFGDCDRLSIRHKGQKDLSPPFSANDQGFHTRQSRRNNKRFFHSEDDDSLDTVIQPHLLDPKDVAVLYQLQTVTQSPSKNSSTNEGSKPHIIQPDSTYVSTRAGQTAALTCTVQNLGDRQVSWIRGRDLHVLSSGIRVFASDSRVRVVSSGSRWNLIIRYSQPRDGGLYACQINTEEPIALWLNLTVIEARAIIEAPSTIYIQEGSTMTLTCRIKEELVIPGLVLWYHGDALVPRDSDRIKVLTETKNITTSVLNITRASTIDSGNYSCWPSSGKPDTTFVHVIKGDPPAAMHHGNYAPMLCPSLWLLPTYIFFIAIPYLTKGNSKYYNNLDYYYNFIL